MQITIHRGISQIGGCITEISTEASRIFIDMGDNLPGAEKALSCEEKQAYVVGLFSANAKADEAVFYTHAHADHMGMMEHVPDGVPQYMSGGSKWHCDLKYRLLNTLDEKEEPELHRKSERHLALLKEARVLNAPVKIGDISVTAYEVPHSAFGSVMLLVEADGERILHTGDFKQKGLAADFLAQIERVGQVDVLITEGTMLKRSQTLKTEEDVRKEMAGVMCKHKYVFVLTSSLNSDRLSSVALAAVESPKPLTVCSSMMRKSIEWYQRSYPEMFGEYVKFYPFNEISENATEATLQKIQKFEKWVDKEGFVQVVGIGQLDKVRETLKGLKLNECALIYSMWDGYYKNPEQIALNPDFQQLRGMFEYVYDIHTSGHAEPAIIAEMVRRLNPRETIIGIHKEADASLCNLDIPADLKAKVVPDAITPDYISIKD